MRVAGITSAADIDATEWFRSLATHAAHAEDDDAAVGFNLEAEAEARAEAARAVAGDVPVEAFPTVRGALVEARRRADGQRCVFVFGSFHTAAEAFEWFHE